MASRLVIAYDGSANAATAVRVAASLFPAAEALIVNVPRPVAVPATTGPALPMHEPISVQRVIDELSAQADEEARATAEAGAEQARTGGLQAEAVPVAARAPVWEALQATALERGADVLVCGTRGRGAFVRALLGSTASSLVHNAALPLLVVPDGGGRLDGPALIAYDGSDGAKQAIDVVGRLLGDRAAVVVHAWESAYHRSLAARAIAAGPVDDLRETVEVLERSFADTAAATTQEGVERARAAGLEAVGDTVESVEGVWRAVAAAGRMHGAAVIVTGARGLGGARSALLGSVSSGLVHNAELPVLVVPA